LYLDKNNTNSRTDEYNCFIQQISQLLLTASTIGRVPVTIVIDLKNISVLYSDTDQIVINLLSYIYILYIEKSTI